MQDEHHDMFFFFFLNFAELSEDYLLQDVLKFQIICTGLYVLEIWHVSWSKEHVCNTHTCFSDTMIGSFRTIQMTLSCRGGVVSDPE